MAALTTILLAASAALAGAGATAGVLQGRRTARAARREGEAGRRAQEGLAAESEREGVRARRLRAREALRRRRSLLGDSRSPLRETLLTGPSGIPNLPSAGTKTLLGE